MALCPLATTQTRTTCFVAVDVYIYIYVCVYIKNRQIKFFCVFQVIFVYFLDVKPSFEDVVDFCPGVWKAKPSQPDYRDVAG